jgi:hypothetical protein
MEACYCNFIQEHKYNTEKRFVENRGIIFPPLLLKSFVVYPQVDYQKEGASSFKWDV